MFKVFGPVTVQTSVDFDKFTKRGHSHAGHGNAKHPVANEQGVDQQTSGTQKHKQVLTAFGFQKNTVHKHDYAHSRSNIHQGFG